MAVALPDDLGATVQKGLSEWWSEETEYVFQRIERWAAFARGYNRLRSQRLSRGRLTMQEDQEPGWRISSSKLVIDDTSWSPRFKKSRRRSRPEELRINCCGRFNYQSSSNLDSSCLETYRYDHSIYFKTIGDLRSSKRDLSPNEDDRVSISSEELVEWDAEAASEFITTHFNVELPQSDSFNSNSRNDELNNTSWPIVDFSHLQIEQDSSEHLVGVEETLRNATNREKCFEMMRQESEEALPRANLNNNYAEEENFELEDVDLSRLNNNLEDSDLSKGESQDSRNYLGFGRGRSSKVSNDNSSLIIENGVEWSDILLSPTDNVDPPTYSL